ncbi:MAG: hypothetical protein IJA41_07940 [Clostridia bacterium]|nr:hypothetical protein [Clostridia bacterium]
MSKKVKLSVAVVSVVLVVAALIVGALWHFGAFVTDRSAVVGLESLEWQGRTYSPRYGKYDLGRRIAKTTNGLDVYEIKGDPEHNFLLVSSFVDSILYVSDDYEIPTSGTVTRINWNYKDITDKVLLQAVVEIIADRCVQGSYKSPYGGLFVENEVQNLEALYVAYDNCPVATVNMGFMGKLNGKWIITVEVSPDRSECKYYNIPDQYVGILERYF